MTPKIQHSCLYWMWKHAGHQHKRWCVSLSLRCCFECWLIDCVYQNVLSDTNLQLMTLLARTESWGSLSLATRIGMPLSLLRTGLGVLLRPRLTCQLRSGVHCLLLMLSSEHYRMKYVCLLRSFLMVHHWNWKLDFEMLIKSYPTTITSLMPHRSTFGLHVSNKWCIHVS